MSELRQNIITRDWVIIATERAKKPNEFAQFKKCHDLGASHREDCPFCLGNEEDIKLELLRISDKENWRVRIIPNKFPALSMGIDLTRNVDGIHHIISGFGYHEVVVEHPNHNVTTALLSIADIVNIVTAYRQRYLEIAKDSRIETIIIFKNHGETAGTSLVHPHSQIAAIPVVPHQFRGRLEAANRYYDDTGDCIFCRSLQDELEDQERIVFQNKSFVAFIPYAALSPFHIWVFPRRHSSAFEEINDDELLDLAEVFKVVLGKLYYGLNDPDYNYTIRSTPIQEHSSKYYHWYLAIVPRVSKQAGFELGSGMYINTALPEASAEFLRSVIIPDC